MEELEKVTIVVPHQLEFHNTIDFVNSFKELRDTKNYVFDFGNLSRIDPFSILLLSSELKIFKMNNQNSVFHCKSHEHCTYAGHMGFFQSFGLNFGKKPGEAKNNNNYIPLKIFNVAKIKKDAFENGIHPAELLEENALEISRVLTHNQDSNLTEILRYCIREILRNIVEHSEAEQFGFCAQYLPSKNTVSFAVLDRGIGIKKGLSSNPKLNLIDDLSAIKASIKPGVSGKVFSGQKNKPKGDWVNSGFGLYMTSNICMNGGSFLIASGNKALYLSQKGERILDMNLNGTALNLTINLNQSEGLKTILEKLRDNIPKEDNEDKIVASKSSMGNLTSKNK